MAAIQHPGNPLTQWTNARTIRLCLIGIALIMAYVVVAAIAVHGGSGTVMHATPSFPRSFR